MTIITQGRKKTTSLHLDISFQETFILCSAVTGRKRLLYEPTDDFHLTTHFSVIFVHITFLY